MEFEYGKFYPVERLDGLEAVRRYVDHHALMLCWPDYDASWAGGVLEAFPGDRILYIGEGESGCTGDDRFHELLDGWLESEVVEIPQWDGVHDDLYLYAREASCTRGRR